MPPFLDARIPLRMLSALPAEAAPDTALLIEARPVPPGQAGRRFDAPLPTHPPVAHPAVNCACCMPLGPVTTALNALFIERAKGGAYFRRILAIPATEHGRAAIFAALHSDPLVATRFRLETPETTPDGSA